MIDGDADSTRGPGFPGGSCRWRLPVGASITAGLALFSFGCGPPNADPNHDAARLARELNQFSLPAEHEAGEQTFTRFCVSCHGPRGAGSDVGPPLVHRVYRPAHHGDAAFRLAVSRGVRAHHWTFGDMPPVPQVPPEEIDAVVAYLRWLQRQVGIE
ncbi:MAG: cytochrome c [Gemmatimonadetes bacterium]|nr:cytochrome c [Gemmatimonadota bacterium]